MLTSNRMKLTAALLGSTFLVSPVLAADNTVTVTDLTATNSDTVNATLDFLGKTSISGSVGNLVTGAAGGAIATASITNQVNGAVTGALPDNAVDGTLINATNNGTGTVAGTVTSFTGAVSITGDVRNSISASAIGSSGTAGISQSAYSTGATTTLNKNTITLSSTVDSKNLANVTLSVPEFKSTVTIGGGVSNSVTTQAVGGAGGASIDQALRTTVVGTNTANNAVTITGATTVSNDGTIANNTTQFTGAVSITTGVNNSVAVQAVGASASGSVIQSASDMPSVLTGTNTVIMTGEVKATNTGSATAGPTTFKEVLTVPAGVSNSVSIGAAGGTVSASVTQALAAPFSGTTAANVVTFGDKATSSNTNTVTAGNATFDKAVTVGATGGVNNSVAVQAVGSSNSAGIGQSLSGTNAATIGNNTVTVTGASATTNSGTVKAGDTTFTGAASVTTGVSNAISNQAIGSSNSASINQSISDPVNTALGVNKVDMKAAMTSTNSGAVSDGAQTLFSTTTSIGGGTGNSINVASIGSSAGASITQSVFNSDTTTFNKNTVLATTITALNNAGGTVGAKATFTGDASITGGVGNVISVQALGAAAGASITARYAK